MHIDLTGMKMIPEVRRTVCEFHKRSPFENYAGCTCSASYGGRWIKDPNPPKKCNHCNGSGIEPSK